jgi:hypothetical protein
MGWLGSTILFFIAAVLGHFILSRLRIPANIVLRFLLVGNILGAGLVWWLYTNYDISAPQMWAGLLVYAFFCELYVFLFTLVISSISANLLINLFLREMTDADMPHQYESSHMVAARLDRLVAADFLEETSDGLKLTKKGVRLVRLFNRMRVFFRHPPSFSTFPTNE